MRPYPRPGPKNRPKVPQKVVVDKKTVHNRNQLIEPVILMYQTRFLFF